MQFANSRRLMIQTCLLTSLATPFLADACTRIAYLGENGNTVTARSMDWKYDIGSNLYILPRGVERNGEAGSNSLRWVSKYGSVVTTAYDVSTADGVNEAGLYAGVLWLSESQYPKFDAQSKPGLVHTIFHT